MTDTPDVISYSDPSHPTSAHESGMTFESAMEAVKLGHKVTRECWPKNEFVVTLPYSGRLCIVEYDPSTDRYGFVFSFRADFNDREAKDWKVAGWRVPLDQTEEEAQL